jgi:hypothetical protein
MNDPEQKAADYRHYRGIERPHRKSKPKNVPFGKHKGQPIAEVPADYLMWMLSLANLSPDLRTAIKADLVRRQDEAQLHLYGEPQ